MASVKRYQPVIFSTIITAMFFLVLMIIKQMEPFGSMSLVNYDCQSQVYPLLCLLHDKLKKGEGFLFAWNAGLGDGFLPTYFYYLSSPINLLVVFIDKSDIRAFINITIMFRLIVSAMTMSFFFINRFEKEKTQTDLNIYIIPLSVAYAFSGFVFGFYHEVMWLDSYMIFPLIMLGYDKLLNEKKPIIYVLTLVYSSLCSFYMTFMIGVFLVLWFVLDNHNSKRDFLKKTILFGVSSMLAIGMTAMSLLVSYIGVMKTHVQAEPNIIHKWFGSIFNILKYQFIFSTPINVSYDNNCANLYCGVFAGGLLFVYIFIKRIKLAERIKRIALILFLVLSLNEALLNFFWHGLHYQLCIPNRFSFLLIFLLLVTAYDALVYAESIKLTIVGLVLAEMFPMICYFFVEFDSLISPEFTLICTLIILLTYSTLMILHVALKKKIVFVVFASFMTCEILANAYISTSYDLSDASRYDEVLGITQELNEKIENNESFNNVFYRSKFLGTNVKNAEYILGINGMAIYNSLISSNALNFSENMGYFRTDVSIDENGGFEPLDDIIGVRYVYSVKEPFLDSTDYELIAQSGDVNVYENHNALSLGYGVSNNIDSLSLNANTVVENINALVSSMCGSGNILEEVIPEYEVTSEGYNVQKANTDFLYMQFIPVETDEVPYVRVSFDIEKNGLYNIYMNYSDYGVISVYVNSEKRRYEYTSFGGVLNLGKLNQGDKVDFLIQNESRMADGYSTVEKPTFELRLEKVNNDIYNEFISYLKQNEMHISEMADGKIKADISLGAVQELFTTLPYDESWHVYENGKEIEKKKMAGAFIGLELGEGQHNIELKYIPQGLYVGSIITIVSWIIFIIWTILLRKKCILEISEVKDE